MSGACHLLQVGRIADEYNFKCCRNCPQIAGPHEVLRHLLGHHPCNMLYHNPAHMMHRWRLASMHKALVSHITELDLDSCCISHNSSLGRTPRDELQAATQLILRSNVHKHMSHLIQTVDRSCLARLSDDNYGSLLHSQSESESASEMYRCIGFEGREKAGNDASPPNEIAKLSIKN